MSLLLLDTTYLIDAERADADIGAGIEDDDDVAIAAITVAELRVGVELASTKHRPERQAFLDDILGAIPVLPYDLTTAEAHAGLLATVRRQGKPRGAHDLVIAATAKASRRTVLTADASAFADLPGVEMRHHR